MKIPILRDPNTVHAKFRWVGEDTTLYLLDHMNAFTLEHVLLWKEGTDTYANHDEDIREWLNTIIIASSMYELNIGVIEKIYLLNIIE